MSSQPKDIDGGPASTAGGVEYTFKNIGQWLMIVVLWHYPQTIQPDQTGMLQVEVGHNLQS